MTSIDPPEIRRPPSHCYGWPLDLCDKFRKSDYYTLSERKQGLRYVQALDAWLCQPCYRSYQKEQQAKRRLPVTQTGEP